MQAKRDHKGLFLPGPETAQLAAQGGASKSEHTKRRGFGSHPELARELALKNAEKRRAKREQSTG